MGATGLRQLLKSFCKDSYWNYAVFWQIRHGNPMILTWEDGYFDYQKPIPDACGLGDVNDIFSSCGQINMHGDSSHGNSIGQVVAGLSSFCYNLGEGVVGKVAYMQNHSWINLDKILCGEDSCNLIHEGRFPEEWLYQWALGIKTILLIPFLQQGVLQLGSLEEVSEDLPVVSYIKSRFDLHYIGLNAALFPKNKDSEAEFSSLMYYNSVDELDETSTITFESTEIDDVRLKMNNTETENQVVPLFTIQDTFYVCGNNQPEFLEMVESEQPESHDRDFEGMFEDFSNSVTDFYSTMDQPFKDEDILVSSFLGFPKHSELHKALGPTFQEQAIENSWDSPFLVEDINCNLGLISGRDPINSIEPSQLDAGYLLEAVVDNKFTGLEKKSGNRSVGSSIISSGVSTLVSKEQPGNDCLFMESKKGANPSKVGKIKAKPGENHKPRPRDRQMIQDRLKEIRELVPNGKNCSIDGLLDRTIRHMLYLRSVTDQAENLKKWTLHEVTADLKSQSTKINDDPHKGTSWVFELGKGHQVCPIVVEDLPLPGFLLIEMLCDNHGFFLEITSEILRLKLTILKGATETRSCGTWAYFIVETSKGFHRMEIFWPLMNLLQRQRYMSRRQLDVL